MFFFIVSPLGIFKVCVFNFGYVESSRLDILGVCVFNFGYIKNVLFHYALSFFGYIKRTRFLYWDISKLSTAIQNDPYHWHLRVLRTHFLNFISVEMRYNTIEPLSGWLQGCTRPEGGLFGIVRLRPDRISCILYHICFIFIILRLSLYLFFFSCLLFIFDRNNTMMIYRKYTNRGY